MTRNYSKFPSLLFDSIPRFCSFQLATEIWDGQHISFYLNHRAELQIQWIYRGSQWRCCQISAQWLRWAVSECCGLQHQRRCDGQSKGLKLRDAEEEKGFVMLWSYGWAFVLVSRALKTPPLCFNWTATYIQFFSTFKLSTTAFFVSMQDSGGSICDAQFNLLDLKRCDPICKALRYIFGPCNFYPLVHF